MYGYVTIHRPELKFREFDEYQGAYCGLCKTLKKEYGAVGQMTLSYDMTFLAILLDALYEGDEKRFMGRCALHPVEKRPRIITPYTFYAADMSVLLAYYKGEDNKKDDRSIKGYLESFLFRKKAHSIAKKYPRQAKTIARELEELARLEKNKETNIDLVSGTFGRLLGEIFQKEEDHFAENLREMGFYLGKFIYIMDAYEDLKKDQKKGNYNPFLYRSMDDAESMLTMMMAECSKYFERLPIIKNAELLRNILYAGVWQKFEILKKRGEGHA